MEIPKCNKNYVEIVSILYGSPRNVFPFLTYFRGFFLAEFTWQGTVRRRIRACLLFVEIEETGVDLGSVNEPLAFAFSSATFRIFVGARSDFNLALSS